MKQLDRFWTELQPLLTNLATDEQESLSAAFGRARKESSLLESKYHRTIRDRAAVHALLTKTSEDLIQRYQTLFENSGTAMVVIENDGTISLANTLFLNLLGYQREEVENRKNYFTIFNGRFRKQAQDYHRRKKAGDPTAPQMFETQVVSSGGNFLDVIIMIGSFPGTDQNVASIIDITDRKRMEDELRLLKISVDRGYDEVFWMDMDANILYVNEAACRTTGYSPEELYAMKIYELDPDFTPGIWEKAIEDLRENKKRFFTTRHKCKDGRILNVEISSVYVAKGDREYSFCFVHDITERKRTEEELSAAHEQLVATEHELRKQFDQLAASQVRLQESEKRFQSVFNNVNDAIFMQVVGEKGPGKFMEVNDFMCKSLGYTREELLTMTIADILTEAGVQEVPKVGKALKEKGQYTFVAGVRRKDGTTFQGEVNSRMFLFSGRRVVLAIARDVTERKRAEEAILRKNDELNAAYEQQAAIEQELRANLEELGATEKKLRESEAWLREFTGFLPQFVYEIDNSGRLVFVNQHAAAIVGITPEILAAGVNIRDVIIPEEWENLESDLALTLTGTKNTHTVFHARIKDGSQIPVNIYSAPVYRDGTHTGFRGIIVDITETFQAQEALQKSERRFRELAELLPQIVFELDESLKFTFFNWNTIEMTGFAYDDLSQKRTGITEIIRQSDRHEADLFFTNILKNSISGQLASCIVSIDGKEIPVTIYATPIVGENRVAGIRGVIVDISEQKSLELALRESEVRFRELAGLIPQFIFETDRNFRFTYFNLAGTTLTGYSDEEFTKGLDIFSLVEMADRNSFRESCVKALGGEVVHPLQFSLIKRDQEKVPVIMYVSHIYRQDEYSGLRGIIVDIADQKRLEKALATINQKLNMMNTVTRHDVLNSITGLLGLVDMLSEITSDSKAQVLLAEIRNLIIAIKDQIIFTKDYQSLGVKAPQWQSLCNGIGYTASAIGMDTILLKQPRSDYEIYADPFFGRVFYNLIDNSKRHGGSVRFISIETEIIPEGDLIIRYHDDGIGIPPDEKNMIFEQGFGKNTGFGLFIIREILGITGLSIRETGTFRNGVLFEITVPKEAWRPVTGSESGK